MLLYVGRELALPPSQRSPASPPAPSMGAISAHRGVNEKPSHRVGRGRVNRIAVTNPRSGAGQSPLSTPKQSSVPPHPSSGEGPSLGARAGREGAKPPLGDGRCLRPHREQGMRSGGLERVRLFSRVTVKLQRRQLDSCEAPPGADGSTSRHPNRRWFEARAVAGWPRRPAGPSERL